MATTTKLIVFNEVLRELGTGYQLTDPTTVNQRQVELNGRFDHAVEYVLSQDNWSFARRRSTLTASASTAFPPYTHIATRPSDWLRTCWVKTNANDRVELDHAGVASSIYMFVESGLIEYISDHADNYDPANWPPHFTRVLVLYLAFLTAPVLARAGDDVTSRLNALYEQALDKARAEEARFLTNAQIPINRHPVFARALEMLGQGLAGHVNVYAHNAKLYWQMNEAWDHALQFCLEQGAWNFASRRARLTGGTYSIPGGEIGDFIPGYSVGPAPAEEPAATSDVDISEYEYGYTLPDDFVHKLWVKSNVHHDMECDHQILGRTLMADYEPVIMEYVSKDEDAVNPANWPATFMEVVAAHLATITIPELQIVEGSKMQRATVLEANRAMLEMFTIALRNARNKDAAQQQARQRPYGPAVRARMGYSGVGGLRRRNYY